MKFAPGCGLLQWLCLLSLMHVISAYDYYDIDHTVNCNLIDNDWNLTENLSYLWYEYCHIGISWFCMILIATPSSSDHQSS